MKTRAQDQTGQPPVLPRAFQHARLGMAYSELVRVRPELAKTSQRDLATTTLNAPSVEPYIKQVAYRFYRNTLYEIHIQYRPDRLPNGVTGLLAWLKELYGQPAVDRDEEMDVDSGDLHRRRTVWQDMQTRITLLEREYFRTGTRIIDVTLTLTDLQLAEMRDRDHDEQARQRIKQIPVPLPDTARGEGQAASLGNPTPLAREPSSQPRG